MKKILIPHSKPTIGKEEADAVSKVVRSGHIAQGKNVEEFEEKLAKFVGVKGAVAVNSGSAALHLGLVAMGLDRKKEILLPSYVCTAPLNAVYMANAKPKICDIEIESFNISLDSIDDNKTDSANVVIVPHMFGNIADLEKIEEMALVIVEDCAHSIGGTYGKKKAGSIGVFSIVSFYANKMMACGEGGVLLSSDENLLKTVRDLREYDEKEDYRLRFNYKMTDIEAAIGLVQLKKLPGMIKKRKEIAARYDKALNGLDVILPKGEFDHVYYRYIIRTKKNASGIIAKMREKGIMCAKPVYKPLHRYLGMRSGFRNTDEVYSQAVSIPIYPLLSIKEQSKIVEAIKEII
ncbi:MAG: DegT/DnrJ/EryC1/StrS aminotransferase family protein [Candidatus Omnitrophica bacterium]|nr:DegT/DnrJ/EryC1/StrS aminotransferase family protein [Candidatus Omnitrophota bacterium]